MVSRCDYRSDDCLVVNNPTVAALCYPEITKRIQTELDNTVGRDRMPTFDDERSLPFLGAFIKEITRCVLLYVSVHLH
jgi:hypothetical protein